MICFQCTNPFFDWFIWICTLKEAIINFITQNTGSWIDYRLPRIYGGFRIGRMQPVFLNCVLCRVSLRLLSKLIECIISLLMLAVVIFIMVRRVWKECQFNFYIAISVTMALTLTCIYVLSQLFQHLQSIPKLKSSTFSIFIFTMLISRL